LYSDLIGWKNHFFTFLSKTNSDCGL
jgi:hypothetical protein